MSTKITTPVLIDLPGETLPSENTAGVILPKGTTGERPGIISVEYLVVAGGGGGGSRTGANGSGAGGGGAGGLLTSWPSGTALNVSSGVSIDITVGEGGIGANTPNSYATGGDGGDSIFASLTAKGGGGGASGPSSGNTGGSGGGSGYNGTGGNGTIGQGNNGGSASSASLPYAAGGGGGSNGVGGTAASSSVPGTGGAGLSIDITNASVTYAAGGDGSIWTDGGSSNESNNTGNGSDGAATAAAGNGGSGVVILRYPDTYTIVETTSVLTFTTDSTSVANTKITTFTAGTSGVIEFTPTITPSTGEFRYNTTDKLVEFYNGSVWKQIADEYISGQPSTCACNFPTTATALYQLEDNTNDTCGSNNATNTTDITYNSSGKFGKSAVFNGTSSYFKLPFSTLGNSAFTFSLWLNFDDLASERFIFSKYPGSGGYGFICQSPLSASTITFTAYSGSTGYSVTTTTSMSTGVWYNYVLTFDFSSSIKAYLNGSQEATTTPSGPFNQNSDTVFIGRYWNGATYFDGEMDQIRLFPSALTPDQVTELYNEVVCT